jgi:hypothetical protein
VGYQARGTTNTNQISFDETLLLRYSFNYMHTATDPADITKILWWEQPRAGGSAGLSATLAQRLENAADATNGRFSIEIDFPETRTTSRTGKSTGHGGSGGGGIGIPVPIFGTVPEPVLAGYGSGGPCEVLA